MPPAGMDFVVLDTNVVVSALRSKRGASFAILRRIGEAWTPLISVPLILEEIVRAFCFFGREIPVYFQVRPSLPDPGDEFLLELAVAGRADAIVTHNVKHFAGAEVSAYGC